MCRRAQGRVCRHTRVLCRERSTPDADSKPADWEDRLGSPNKTDPPVRRTTRNTTTGRSGDETAAGCTAGGRGSDGVWLMCVLLLALVGRRQL